MNEIEFIPSDKNCEILIPPPIPSKNCIPDWYKSIPGFKESELIFDESGQIINKSIKMCMPFLDALTFGYIQKTWTDIYIEINNNSINYYYSDGPQIISARENISMPIPNDLYQIEFAWKQPWIPKTKKGYSVIICNPNNGFHLPFITSSGVVDSDSFFHTPYGNVPFYIKNGFSGLIPAGTPMYQIIPFKRENWKSKKLNFNELEIKKNNHDQRKNFWGFYKKNIWSKKEFQ